MKRTLCILMSITILVALVALVSLIVVERRGQEEPGITGTWEATVNILGENAEPGETGTMAFRFYKDMTGKLIPPAGRNAKSESFSYFMTEDTLNIKFSDDEKWSFPYQLEGDTLTLTQNHNEIVYTRRK